MSEPTPIADEVDEASLTESIWWPGLDVLKQDGFIAGWAPVQMEFMTREADGTPLLLRVRRQNFNPPRFVAFVDRGVQRRDGTVRTWRPVPGSEGEAASPWHAARAAAINMGWLTRADVDKEQRMVGRVVEAAEQRRADDVKKRRHLSPVTPT